MILDIHHRTRYTYSKPVFPEPHHLYFYPSLRSYFQLRSFELNVSPDASGLAFRIDAENNAYHQCWFNHEVNHLEIDMKMSVETYEINPFHFYIEDNPKIDQRSALVTYLHKESLANEITEWVSRQKNLTGNVITFLTYINKEIYNGWTHATRYDNNLMTPQDCFSEKEGSCRDLSWMMIQMLRNLDIPARFVSGYAYNPDLEAGHELHAWVEAWIPGAGWIGLDPSSGLLATNNYIPVSSSYIPENTLPVQGIFRGDATSRLEFEVQIEISPDSKTLAAQVT